MNIVKTCTQYDVSMGINVLSSESLDLIPSDGKFDIPELMTALIRAGKRLCALTQTVTGRISAVLKTMNRRVPILFQILGFFSLKQT